MLGIPKELVKCIRIWAVPPIELTPVDGDEESNATKFNIFIIFVSIGLNYL